MWFIYKYTVTFGVVKSGLYGKWLQMGWTSRTLLDNAAKETEKLKNKIREDRYCAQRKQRKEEEKRWEQAHGVSPSATANERVGYSRDIELDDMA